MILTLCRFEWRPADALIGVFWRHGNIKTDEGPKRLFTDVWIFFLPYVPLHLTFMHSITIPFNGDSHAESVQTVSRAVVERDSALAGRKSEDQASEAEVPKAGEGGVT
jgi:hypothetical protein